MRARGFKAFIVAGLLALGVGAAAAQEGPARLGADEARAALYGHELSGVTEITGEAWSECIGHDGRTIFRIGAETNAGRLEIRANGDVCFRYASTDFQRAVCWALSREGARLRFDPIGLDSEAFIVTARPRVSGCDAETPVV